MPSRALKTAVPCIFRGSSQNLEGIFRCNRALPKLSANICKISRQAARCNKMHKFSKIRAEDWHLRAWHISLRFISNPKHRAVQQHSTLQTPLQKSLRTTSSGWLICPLLDISHLHPPLPVVIVSFKLPPQAASDRSATLRGLCRLFSAATHTQRSS